MLKEIKAFGPNNNTVFEQINRNHPTRNEKQKSTAPTHNNSLFFSEGSYIVVHFKPFAFVQSFPLA